MWLSPLFSQMQNTVFLYVGSHIAYSVKIETNLKLRQPIIFVAQFLV